MQQAERMRRRTPWYVFVIVLVVAALVASAFLWARPGPSVAPA
jgi:hypothetical protein